MAIFGSTKKIVIIIAIITIFLVVAALIHNPLYFVFLYHSKTSLSESPFLNVTPSEPISIEKEKIDLSILHKIEAGSIAIYLKDQPSELKIARLERSFVGVIAKDGRKIVINSNPTKFSEVIKDEPEHHIQQFKKFFGENSFKKIYEFHKEVFESTPDSISIMSSKDEVIKTAAFILYKEILAPVNSEVIKQIKFGDIDILQFGEPKNRQKRVVLNFYPHDNKYYALTLSGFNQKEIFDFLQRVEIIKENET